MGIFSFLRVALEFLYNANWFDLLASTGGLVASIGILPQLLKNLTVPVDKLEGFGVHGWFLFMYAQCMAALVALRANNRWTFWFNLLVFSLQVATVLVYYVRRYHARRK